MGRGAKVKKRGRAIKNHHQLQSFFFARIRGDEAIEGALDFGAHVFRHAVVVEHAVEVVVLVLENASLKAIQGHFELFPLQVLSLDLDTNRTLWIEKRIEERLVVAMQTGGGESERRVCSRRFKASRNCSNLLTLLRAIGLAYIYVCVAHRL